MIAVAGIYQNGQIKLEQEIPSQKPLKVIVTFLMSWQTLLKNGFAVERFFI